MSRQWMIRGLRPAMAFLFLGLVLVTVSEFSSLSAQSTFASIVGEVTDSSGAVVPNANVEVKNTRTGFVFKTTSNNEGFYTFTNLLDGEYELTVNMQGFETVQVKGILLSAREVRRIPVVLAVQGTATMIEVSAGAAAIETETVRVSDSKNREQLRALPLTLRRTWDYMTMTPQIGRAVQGFAPSFAGTRNNQSEASIDGITIARPGGGFGFGPLMDRTENLQELRVEVSGNSAEYASPGGMLLITRSGTNEFHGVFSDYYSTPVFRARNPFATARSTGVTHRLTFSAGGPVFLPKIYDGRNRTFFFWTTEVFAGSASNVLIQQTAPLDPWRSGDFSNLRNSETAPLIVVRDPLSGNPFPDNRIPSARLNRVALRFQELFYARPNFGDTRFLATNNYRENRLNPFQNNPTHTIRGDHRFGSKALVTARFIGVYWNIPLFESMPTITQMIRRTRDMRSFMTSYTHTITPALINEFRWGYAWDEIPVESTIRGKRLAEELGLQGLAPGLPDVGGVTNISFVGIGVSGISTQATCGPCFRDKVTHMTNNLSWARGRHFMKMGLDLRFGQTDDVRQPGNLFGAASFTNRYTGFPYADFLLGMPNQLQRAFPTVPFDRQIRMSGFYFQDDWKPTSRLTLNLGLRYQYYAIPRDANGRMAMFDVASGRIVIPDGSSRVLSPFVPEGYVEIVEAGRAGFPNALMKTDKNNFAPRLGLAFRLRQNTVIRAGAGIYYDNAPPAPALGATAPFVVNEPAFINTAENPVMLPVIFPATGTGRPTTIGLPTANRPDIRVPFTGQYTVSLDHEQWGTGFRLTYTGTNTRQGIWRYDINQPLPDDQPYSAKPRLFPRYPGILYSLNGAGHQYHGATIEARRPLRGGFSFQAYYTLARDIGDLDNAESPENAYDRRRERAPVQSASTHRFSGNMIYELPFGKGRRWMNQAPKFWNAVLGGWILSNIYSYESGQFLTPTWTGPDPTGTRFANPGQRAQVTLRPDRLRNGNLDNPTVDRWFDLDAFAAPPVGRFGTSAKGVIIGPPTNVFHSSIAKEFRYAERVRIRLEGLATNLFNHPNWAAPNMSITAGVNSGRVTNVIDRNAKFDSAVPRELQVQFRVEW